MTQGKDTQSLKLQQVLLKASREGTSLVAQVVKNPPAKAGNMGSVPGLERSHMPRDN